MSDLIDRQAAIETVMECYDNDELFEVYEDKLRELPPANNSEKSNSSDTISIQAAIDALNEVAKDYSITAFDAIASILDLPPAQPEIIRCKDCKYGILDCDFPHERYCDFKGNEWNNDDHFCGHAKRREVTT